MNGWRIIALAPSNSKKIVELGDRVKLISLIKSVCATGARRIAEGKKNYLADEAAMRKAEHVLYSEIAAVVGIAEENVPEYIAQIREADTAFG